jgi:hypothetical protein
LPTPVSPRSTKLGGARHAPMRCAHAAPVGAVAALDAERSREPETAQEAMTARERSPPRQQ